MTATAYQPALRSVADHLAQLQRDGERLGEAAATTALDAPVPSCPEWDLTALLQHIGSVHHWAATIVREQRQERLERDRNAPTDRDELLAWYRDGFSGLLAALAAATPDQQFWYWAPGPNAAAFWTRRQAHETAVHRLDAELAAGVPTPFPAAAAADGIDEWLGIAALWTKVPDGRDRRLHLAAADEGVEWAVELGADGIQVVPGASSGDVSVRAPASELFALAMNRRDHSGLDVTGDLDVLRVWRDGVKF